MNSPPLTSAKKANVLDVEEYSRSSLRRAFREKRSVLTKQQQASAAQEVLKQAIAYKIFDDCSRVAIYLTNEGELDTQPLIEYLWAQGKEVYLPVLHPFSKGYLLFLRYTPSTVMKANNFGILEPILNVMTLCPIAQLDIVLTPLVAFDEKGNRMGMGGGFYDRTIKGIASKQSRLIGLAHDCQKTVSLPIQVWDIPLPEVLTPTSLFSFNRNHNGPKSKEKSSR